MTCCSGPRIGSSAGVKYGTSQHFSRSEMAVFDTAAAHRETAKRTALANGTVIPAHPLALNAARRLDERSQRALSRYYIAAGAGGLAIGVHTTQFLIHD